MYHRTHGAAGCLHQHQAKAKTAQQGTTAGAHSSSVESLRGDFSPCFRLRGIGGPGKDCVSAVIRWIARMARFIHPLRSHWITSALLSSIHLHHKFKIYICLFGVIFYGDSNKFQSLHKKTHETNHRTLAAEQHLLCDPTNDQTNKILVSLNCHFNLLPLFSVNSYILKR